MNDSRLVSYRVVSVRPEAHLFEVSCTVSHPNPEGQAFALPAWIPGSYLVRDFARHVVSIQASSGRQELALRKTDKHTWQCAPAPRAVTVTLQVYAFDSSVRGAFLDTQRGFFNGPCLFLRPIGHEQVPCQVDIVAPAGAHYRGWKVATSLSRAGAAPLGFGTYWAADYDELIDHPVELGTFSHARFRACGVPHEIAISGRHDADLSRLTRDLKQVCETQIRFFGGRSEQAPFERYVFLVNAQGEAYGGLEHRASTALLCSRHQLPQPGTSGITDEYRTFLGLASHEYFHAWNVKRLRPKALTPYQLDRENHTNMLWLFEGVTSYYDDLMLVRSGLISPETYLETLSSSITNLQRTPGRHKQTLEEASWDAWIKYYRQDEDSPNSQVSYYLKGALAALCLDLLIRSETDHRKSLDQVMRAAWKRHGKAQSGIAEGEFESLAEDVTGVKLATFFRTALRTTRELPLAALLQSVGVKTDWQFPSKPSANSSRAAKRIPDLGVRTAEDAAGVKLTHVLEGGAGQRAGLCPGDVILAVDGLRVTAKTFERQFHRLEPGRPAQLHLFRRDELMQASVTPDAAKPNTCHLTPPASPLPKSYRSWLGL
jgi:predicted metalloprotease with PDZ domain